MRSFERPAPERRRVPALWLIAAAQFAVAPAAALQILEAADHAELSAEVSSSQVNRIAVEGDRIARVVQSAGRFTLEHDPVHGDLYLYPGERSAAAVVAQGPVTLYLGTEKGLTYRLTLNAVKRESAQILIRNVAVAGAKTVPAMAHGTGRENEIVALIGAVARREPLPGYAVVAAPDIDESAANDHDPARNVSLIEIWRGPRFTARILEVSGADIQDASALAAEHGPRVIGAWLSGAAHGGPAHSSPADGDSADGDSADGDPADGTLAGRSPAGTVSDADRLHETRIGVVVEANALFEVAP